jgi:DNA-binding NarL/FixJ family response regulator
MRVAIFSKNSNVISNLSRKLDVDETLTIGSFLELEKQKESLKNYILLSDIELIKSDSERFFNITHESLIDVVLISTNPTFAEGFEYINKGIKGYINAYISKSHLEDLLTSVKNGKVWFYPEFVQQLIKIIPSQKNSSKLNIHKLLTPKEIEVGELLSQGLSNKEIAAKLDISERTVKAHISSMYEKLPIKRDRVSLAIAIKENL